MYVYRCDTRKRSYGDALIVWPMQPVSDSMLSTNRMCLLLYNMVLSMWVVPLMHSMGVQMVRDLVLIWTPSIWLI